MVLKYVIEKKNTNKSINSLNVPLTYRKPLHNFEQ